MNGYKLVPLAELFSIQKGKKIVPSVMPTDIRYIQIEDLRDDSNLKWAVQDQAVVSCDEQDVLLAWDGANAGEFGYGLNGAVGSTLAKLSPLNGSTHTPYIGLFLKSKTPFLRSRCTGATIPHISRRTLEELLIPLPPLPTQRRIAAILDKAQALVANDRRTLAVYDQLAKSLFLEMFGDPVRNERGWEKKSIRKVLEKISDGPFGSNLKSDHYADEGIRVIRLTNVGVGVFIDNDRAYVRPDHFEKIKKYSCGPGDVLVATMGTPNLRACKFPKDLDVAIHKADNVLLRPDKSQVLDDYLVGLFNSPAILSMAANDMHGQTRTRISMGQIAKWSVPIPPLSVQRKYQKAIVSFENLKEELNTSLLRSEGLFGSLLQGAFRGGVGRLKKYFQAEPGKC